MKNIFDFHFHLLFKHLISTKNNQKLPLSSDFKTKGVMSLIDEFMGNAFDSQSSPNMVRKSNLGCGVTALLAMEYAFAENISGLFRNLGANNLPINWNYIDTVKNRKTTYFDLFKKEIQYHTSNFQTLEKDFNIKFLNRKEKTSPQVLDDLKSTYLAFSVEGAHNFSDAVIRDADAVTDPVERYREIQDDPKSIDMFSINLVHLSEIPEQHMCSFAQALTPTAQQAFRSEDFTPKTGYGISKAGEDFMRAVMLHRYPTLVDIKHMSVFSRYRFYQFKEELGMSHPETLRLPIISSHSGFTFCPLESFLENKEYTSAVRYSRGMPVPEIQARNRQIGKTNFLLNNKLYSNPWTINLFDEEIAEIMRSNGMIGISLDQRILGASKSTFDGMRGDFFKDVEAIPLMEFEKWFKTGTLDMSERIYRPEAKTSREVRHIFLLCAHILHAVRIGYQELNWVGEKTPWDHISLGSDFDGLINPINPYDNITKLDTLKSDLLYYLPVAEKRMEYLNDIRVFKNKPNEPIDAEYLEKCVDKFLYLNGKTMLQRFLKNWK